MKIEKYVCDKCEKEIGRNEIYKIEIKEGLGIDGDFSFFHLCENCTKKFFKWIKSHE